ncbi:hypothetical protein PTSG_08879 [Salpingoeca rosetta]|uniref:Phospholipid/glycerol acyltransferase domain-containing protein n=1 Tax=Salpingoeca rosetta (strain ATCC 50818 / BSB-021) TaxID=946362 RepID=F2UKZ0_SALR5|nr:uncharacterized protein PTSG_08879 [Salpingoeca rosetta]EGD77789.1 hypothetical protein PTSG_08879 [Salpingoeca rosetta]|eukprot:XP_004990265.1 hypothetical protein PTSG_08879 [Salpingoeca rosetta]
MAGVMDVLRMAYGMTYMLTMTVCAWAVFMFLFTPLAFVFLLLPSLPSLIKPAAPRAGNASVQSTTTTTTAAAASAAAAAIVDNATISHLAWTCRRFFHQGARAVSVLWFYFVCGLFELATSIRLRVAMDPACRENERAIVIANHHCHIDWYPLLCLLARLAQLDHTRILLKDSLKRAPIYGWGFQCFLYIFLARRRDRDLGWIDWVLSYLHKQKEPSSLMIFPEGTDYSPENLDKSNAFTRERGLKSYKHVLHPRIKGLQAILAHRHQFDALYDCTIAYQYFAEDEPPMEAAFVYGRYPPCISIHVKRFPIKDIPESADKLQDWCIQRFVEKDALLDECGGSSHRPMSGWADMKDADDRALGIVRVRYIIGMALAIGLAVIAGYGLMHSTLFRVYALVATAAWAVVCNRGEGLDRWLVKHPPATA